MRFPREGQGKVLSVERADSASAARSNDTMTRQPEASARQTSETGPKEWKASRICERGRPRAGPQLATKR